MSLTLPQSIAREIMASTVVIRRLKGPAGPVENTLIEIIERNLERASGGALNPTGDEAKTDPASPPPKPHRRKP